MLDEEQKREMLEDASSKKRRKAFEEADKKAEEFIKKNRRLVTVDKVIDFLMHAQEITGPFPISKETPTPPHDFRL